MRDFFRGWKRKIGVVTLAIACVFAGLWVRSLRIEDTVAIHWGTPTIVVLCSDRGSAEWGVIRMGWPLPSATNNIKWISEESSKDNFRLVDLADDPLREDGGSNGRVDYWIIVTPLTLLSAWLLLRKPRQKKAPPPTAPLS